MAKSCSLALVKYRKIVYVLIITAFTLLLSCKPALKGSAEEGVIEYHVTAVNPNSTMAAMAPNAMTVKFKNDVIAAEMRTGMSTVAIKFISDNKTNKFTQLVRILNQKYTCSADGENLKTLFKNVPEYTIIKVNEFKTIAGIKCQKAEIFEKGKANHLFDVYYTDVFKLSKPNWWNEFSGIEGMLMEYQMKRFNIELHFMAIKYDRVYIDSTEFNTKGNYTKISQDELDGYFDVLN